MDMVEEEEPLRRSSIESFLSDLEAPSLLSSGPPKLTIFNSIGLILSLQIGSGVFSAPSQVATHVRSPGEGVLVWIFAGLLAWTGASSFVELGIAIPRNGGVQEYLQYCYGDFVALVFSWIWIFIAKPSSNAIVATILANYLTSAFIPSDSVPLFASKLVGVIAILVIAAINCSGAKTGPDVARGFVVFKLLLIASIASMGIFFCHADGKGVPASKTGWFGLDDSANLDLPWNRFGSWANAVLGALYCYGGWESIGFVVGEMEKPRRTLPLALNSSMMTTITSFTLVVIVFYLCLPLDVIRSNTTLAGEFGDYLYGPIGKAFYSFAIAISALGALNSNIFMSAKLCVSASERDFLPASIANSPTASKVFEVLNGSGSNGTIENFGCRPPLHFLRGSIKIFPTHAGAPVNAILLISSLTIFYIIIRTFNDLIVFVALAEYLTFFLCIIGIFIIRERTKNDPHAYRTRTINPYVFLFVSGALVIRGIIGNILQGVAILAVSLLAYLYFKRIVET